jgi:hypothetical protein
MESVRTKKKARSFTASGLNPPVLRRWRRQLAVGAGSVPAEGEPRLEGLAAVTMESV